MRIGCSKLILFAMNELRLAIVTAMIRGTDDVDNDNDDYRNWNYQPRPGRP